MLPGFPDAAPVAGLLGGVLIGLAAALMLLGAGRIAGVSGIAARACGISGDGMPRSAAWAFVLGLPIGAMLIAWITGGIEASFAGYVPLIVAGLLVGIGARIGSGCTSGHGICGLGRFQPRSLVATLTFMATGVAAATVVTRYLGGTL